MNNATDTDWRELLTEPERARMLADIARVSLAVGCRLFPDQPWSDLDIAAHSLAFKMCPMERLGFLERALPPLAQAWEQIRRDPARETRTTSCPITPPSRARRVSAQAILSAVRRGHADRVIEETVSLPSQDTPENRAVKSFLQTLGQDAIAIAQIAQTAEESEAASRAEQCVSRIQALLPSEWWDEIRTDPGAWVSPPVQRMQNSAAYAQALLWMTRYRTGFAFEWNNPLFTFPQRETWRLYETWCFLTTLDALQAIGWEAARDTAQEIIAVRAGRLTCALAQGEPSLIRLTDPDGNALALSYNCSYPKGELSRSHTMQPDISLLRDGQLWLLDAKFKAYALPGDEGADIVQMHGYRDAITNAEGVPNVARAWCLYAGQVSGFNRPAIAYGDRAASIVGALCLRPGDPEGFQQLCTLLRAWLRTEYHLNTTVYSSPLLVSVRPSI